MLDKETADIIAIALYTNDITSLPAAQLDELAAMHYANDPDVEIDFIGLDNDAGAEGHGTNTEEEMMHTVGDV